MADPTDPSDTAAQEAARLLETINALAKEAHPNRPPEPAALDSLLDRDLGFDSLGKMELLNRLEQAFDRALPEQAFARAETPRDLLRLLHAAASRGGDSTHAIASLPAGPPPAIPTDALTLTDVLDHHADHRPERPHIHFYRDDEAADILTYGELRDGAMTIAAGLQEFGLQPGETVALMLPGERDYFFAFFAILYAGGIPAPLYPPARPSQLEEHLRRHARILDNAQTVALITTAEVKPLGKLLKMQTPSLRHVLTPEEVRAKGTQRAAAPQSRQTGDIAFLQYTSGSTGDPKGVALTHANLLANVRAMGEAVAARPEDVFVSWLPLYHDMGLIGAWLGSLYFSFNLILMTPLAFLARPARWLWAIHRYKGSLSAAPNFAFELLLRHYDEEAFKDLDLSAWRYAFNGAEAVSPATVETFTRRFAPHGFKPEAMKPVFGLAENSVGLAFPPPGRLPRIDAIQREPFLKTGQALPADPEGENPLRFPGCGHPLPGHEIRIADAAGGEMPERRQGNVQFRGPSATGGYYRNPAETRRLFQGSWLNTGDLGYQADGELFITGRRKDLIIRAGRNLHPAELEEAVRDLPGVSRSAAAAFGGTDPDSGTERLVLLVETRLTRPEARDELVKGINARVTDLAGGAPDDVVLAPPGSLLKTSSGKVRRAACRTLYEQGRLGKQGTGTKDIRLQAARIAWEGAPKLLRRLGERLAARLVGGRAWGALALALFPAWALALLPAAPWRWRALRGLLRLTARLAGLRLSLQGIDNLPAPGTPCLLAANHASYLDGFILAATLPLEFSFVAKGELRDLFLTRSLLGGLGVEFVERFDQEGSVADARRMAERARKAPPLLFFPEGTFRRLPGLLPFRMGAFQAALEAEIPVVPVVLRGTREALRDGSWLPRPGRIQVAILPPISVETGQEGWAGALSLRDATRERILQRCGEPDGVR